ncbi:CLUMA_CG021321, isoform A [Clunio marinus]|uniref:CLUMA_CG021321, isoform A n=1 Tax=Clunio marinus TaxID=568069 RepID=A0A1J1J8J7_9DIPT|nr:CLUMA_CG021321, isoform A [Clunio marinus]
MKSYLLNTLKSCYIVHSLGFNFDRFPIQILKSATFCFRFSLTFTFLGVIAFIICIFAFIALKFE